MVSVLVARTTGLSCMDADPSTSEPAPKPKFAGPIDKYLSDKRVEAAVNRAVKCITDKPGRLGARAARLRRDLGGLAAEEHDAGAGE